jgi:3-keto-5-aminohexanoate cleavage enzyme
MKSNKVIITVALCGNGSNKKMSPYVPEQPDEIAADIVKCAKAGASIAHIHIRDKEGKPTMDTEIFKEVCDKTREACAKAGVDIILNLTTSGSRFTEEQRMAQLETCLPEMCTFDPCTMNWANSFVFLNTPSFLEKLGYKAQELGIKPEIEIFDCGHLHNLNYFVKKGILKAPLHIQFILGVVGAMPGNVESLGYMLPLIPEDCTWSISGIGRAHIPMMLAGLAAGCDGLRVGVEDNLYLSHGVLGTNEQLVARAAELVKLVGREVATPAEAREIIGLTKKVQF